MHSNNTTIWKYPPLIWPTIIGLGIALGATFSEGLRELLHTWGTREEYSYGYIIPFITIFLIWQRKDTLERLNFTGSWAGTAMVALGLCLFAVGELSALYLIVQYAFVVVLAGLALSSTGWAAFRIILPALVMLLFMIPLPQFFLMEISTSLQLVSSQIGVAVIRLFNISVFLEGNVIDLGAMKLQVVEACSGLRYLFPLMALGFIAAYFFRDKFWKRAVVFLSTIPITVLMNSLRIGMIGVLVEHWGPSQAEGFLHDFEGWAVFMACTAVLIAEIWILARIGNRHRPFHESFSIDLPPPTAKGTLSQPRLVPKSYLAAATLVVLAAAVSLAMPHRAESAPARQDFSQFPLSIGEWQGKEGRIEQIYLNSLKLDDYIIADYVTPDRQLVNLYVAYYASQRKGQSAHSPRTCIPGGGWQITSLTHHSVEGAMTSSGALRVNRTVIQMGDHKQLVYYWFQQRGRNLTNEYMVKWFIFWDALTRNRTDGALVRLTMPIPPNLDLAEADKQLGDFVKQVIPLLSAYVPE